MLRGAIRVGPRAAWSEMPHKSQTGPYDWSLASRLLIQAVRTGWQ